MSVYNFLETALINAFILLKHKNPDFNRRQQLLLLSISLTNPYIQSNLTHSSSETASTSVSSLEPPAKKPRSKKCKSCPLPHKTKNYATQFCSKCHTPVCPSHFSILCNECKDLTPF